ncbi:MAG: hypothetical protein SCH98_00720 [Deferrisomatales bacterium]|nr:hypothetical protein [Deferrisomatales bacterium]
MDPAAWTQAAAVLGAGLCIGLGAIGAAIGEGRTAEAAAAAIARQPAVAHRVQRTMLVGQAVAESASIFALVVAVLLLFTARPVPSLLQAAALGAAGLCMGVGALGPGLGAGLAGAAACKGIARHPQAAGRVTTAMLVGQAVAQTPAIFALVMAFLLLFAVPLEAAGSLSSAASALAAAAISAGVSAVGPGLGSGMTAAAACHAIARRPAGYASLLRAMLMGQAVAQTPSIFGLLVAFLLVFAHPGDAGAGSLAAVAALLGAGISAGLAATGPGIGSGSAAAAACRAIGRRPDLSPVLVRTMLVGQAVSQSTAVYGLLVALLLLYVV